MTMHKELIRKSFRRGLGSYNDNAFVQQQICDRLTDLVRNQRKQFGSVYEIGTGTGLLTNRLVQTLKIDHYFANDLVPESKALVADIMERANFLNWQFVTGDAESIKPYKKFDLVISASTVQWFDNLALFIDEVSQIIEREGLLVFNTFGDKNLAECKAIAGKGLKYFGMDEIRQILSHRFEIVYCADELMELLFDHPLEVLKHLKKTGVNGHLGNSWTKGQLQQFIDSYNRLHRKGEKVTLTYHPQYFVAKKRNQ
jgi:malonyl-CoA O-methyltransferase